MSCEPIGLELLLSRDMICKYTADQDLQKAVSALCNDWQVIGHFDFLEINVLHELCDLESPHESSPEYSNLRVATGAHSSIVVIPFIDQLHDDWRRIGSFFNDIKSRVDSKSVQEQRCPVLVVEKISLSPAAFEFGPTFSDTLDAIVAARKMVEYVFEQNAKELLSNGRVFVFRTLSSDELVVIGIPTTSLELQLMELCLQECRSMPLGDLAARFFTDANKKSIQDPVPAELAGHAFAAMTEIIAFRLKRDGTFSWADSVAERDEEKSTGIQFLIGIQTDCGHEQTVVSDLRAAHDSYIQLLSQGNLDTGFQVNDATHCLDQYRVTGQISHFSDYVNFVWRTLVSDPWRAENIIDSTTWVKFPNKPSPALQKTERAWLISDAVWGGELREVFENISTWAAKYLCSGERDELLTSVRIFISCFVHHELATSVRDLVPFFRQLSCAMSKENLDWWAAYWRSVTHEEVNSQVDKLLRHLHRAVRNRLEHRSFHADPTVSPTLEHGASKLVGAYTAVMWLSSELFGTWSRAAGLTSGIRLDNPEYCYADELSVCVAAGYRNRVACDEVFEGFRRFVERESCKLNPGNNGAIAINRPGNWSSKLLLLELSGRPLFKPEISLVHALHETAEFSDWLRFSGTTELRLRINYWQITEYEQLLMEAVARRYSSKRIASAKGSALRVSLMHELFDFLDSLIGACVIKAVERYTNDNGLWGDVFSSLDGYSFDWMKSGSFLSDIRREDIVTAVITTLHPIDFSELVSSSVINFGTEHETWVRALDLALTPPVDEQGNTQSPTSRRIPILSNELIQCILPDYDSDSSSFEDYARESVTQLKEICADFGMISAFRAVNLVFAPDESLTPETIRDDVHRIFVSVCEAIIEQAGTAISAGTAGFALTRWAIQVAILSDTWISDICEWLQRSHDKTAKCVLTTLGNALVSRTGNQWSETTVHVHQIKVFFESLRFSREGIFGEDKVDSLISMMKNQDNLLDEEAHEKVCETRIWGFERGSVETLDATQKLLWQAFANAWMLFREVTPRKQKDATVQNAADSRHSVAQVELVFKFWAKSVRLRYRTVFTPAARKSANKNN